MTQSSTTLKTALKTAEETAAAVHAGATTAAAEVDAAIARIEARDGELNAVVARRFDAARAEAKALDSRADKADLPLAGVPMTIKESFDVAGLPTTWGSEAFTGQVADTDSFVAARLKAAGAIILGKTNVPPFLADWQSKNPVYGATHNPHRQGYSPGGSSGGSAASLAAGYVPLEFGTDIGGSVRIPAHFCGVWGHKTTFGLISMDGHFPPGMTGHEVDMSVSGPLARSVGDLELALSLVQRHPLPEPRFHRPDRPLIAVLREHPSAPCDAEVQRAVDLAAEAAAQAGATIVASPKLPDLAAMHEDYIRLLLTAMGRRQPLPDGVERPSLEEWWAMLDAQAAYRRQFDAFFADVDILIAPPAGIAAFPIDDGVGEERIVTINGRGEPWGPQLAYPGLCNYPGLPGTCMPVTQTKDGLPVGVQIIGPQWGDLTTLAAARMIDNALAK
ncbi:MAG: amidase family protein [Pacificimonas sp.]|jgi:amidase|nr:amidase family protein [Pacificimonas sp.]